MTATLPTLAGTTATIEAQISALRERSHLEHWFGCTSDAGFCIGCRYEREASDLEVSLQDYVLNALAEGHHRTRGYRGRRRH